APVLICPSPPAAPTGCGPVFNCGSPIEGYVEDQISFSCASNSNTLFLEQYSNGQPIAAPESSYYIGTSTAYEFRVCAESSNGLSNCTGPISGTTPSTPWCATSSGGGG